MKYTHFYFILFLLLSGIQVNAQLRPEKPTLYYITVDPETGNDIVVWIRSTSAITDYYRVIMSTGITDPPSFIEIDPSIDKADSVFINYNSESGSGSIGYSVVAVQDMGGGPSGINRSLYDRPDSTIFLESVFDSCQASISLTWNDYNNWRGSIAEYNIYRRLGPYVYEKLATLNEGTESFLLTSLDVNQTYELFVEAVHIDGRKSTSNKINEMVNASQQPGLLNADYATLGPGNSVNLSFTVIGSGIQSQYYLMRNTSPTGVFSEIATFSTSEPQILYTDEVVFNSAVYYYRMDGINSCGQTSALSNMANNIILKGALSGSIVSLSWNEYYNWTGSVDRYRIIRTRGRVNPVTDTLDTGLSTNYTEDNSFLANYQDPESSLICYEVQAIENQNIHGIQGKSLSNKVCFSMNPDIRMPNAFIPNDTEPMNQVFEPVFSFLPEHYDMIIYNRLGTKIWEGSEAWDGRVNGKFIPEGVYLYYIRIFNYSTDIRELNGKVTVVYR